MMQARSSFVGTLPFAHEKIDRMPQYSEEAITAGADGASARVGAASPPNILAVAHWCVTSNHRRRFASLRPDHR